MRRRPIIQAGGRRILRYLLGLVVFSAGGILPHAGHAADPLPTLAIDRAQVSVSGVSSGGYMATQMLVAHSASIIGAGVVAAGPWFCAGTAFPWNALTVFTRCVSMPGPMPFLGPPDLAPMVEETRTQGRLGGIDDPSHLSRARVYLFSGANDDIVPRPLVEALKTYYSQFISADRIHLETSVQAEHAMVTTNFGNSCATFAPPFVNNCNYDAAGNLLQQMYGPLNPPADPTGALIAFDQRPFFAAGKSTGGQSIGGQSIGLADEGYAYIPKDCETGGCRLHVAFHGCGQNAADIGDAFYRHAGYNRWAESNRIVVLYPQTVAVNTRLFGRTLPWPNPKGCWDWWGFTGKNYYLRSAPQISAVEAMIDRLSAN